MLQTVGELPCGQSWLTAQWCYSGLQTQQGFVNPDPSLIFVCITKAASVLLLQTNILFCSAHLGHPPLPARIKARLSWQSPWHRKGSFALWLFFLLLPFLLLCRREALAVVSAARGSPAAWHHAESCLGSWTGLISSGRVTLAAKWRQNCWSFCTAPSAPAPSQRPAPSQTPFHTNLTNGLLRCHRWLRHCWLSLLKPGQVFQLSCPSWLLSSSVILWDWFFLTLSIYFLGTLAHASVFKGW